jgi:hypothetical protein
MVVGCSLELNQGLFNELNEENQGVMILVAAFCVEKLEGTCSPVRTFPLEGPRLFCPEVQEVSARKMCNIYIAYLSRASI